MPSFRARALAFVLRKTGVIRRNFTGGPGLDARIAKARAAKPDLPSAKLRTRLDVREEAFMGRPVWHIAPKGHASPKRLLYFHGGGYIYAASAFHWNFLGHLAEKHGVSIIAPLYPLAPEAEVGEITDFALALYKDVLSRHGAAQVSIGGDSAGGGLAAALLMLARDGGLPPPAKALLICPWLEANPTHPDQKAIERRDALLTLSGITDAGRIYAGVAGVADPRVSPIRGDWSAMPEILAFGGGDDLLVTDARALKAKLPAVNYEELAGMMHDWPIFTFPESRAAQAKMGAFLS